MASLDDEQPPWLAEDGVAPLVQAYEARIRELRSQNNSQAKSLLELRHELDAVVQVWKFPMLMLYVMLRYVTFMSLSQENDNLRADLKLATEKLMSQVKALTNAGCCHF